MNSRNSILVAVAVFLLAVPFVARPALAEGSVQCQAHPLCSAASAAMAPQADLLLSTPRLTSSISTPFTLQLIGDCCPNNDSSQCPAIAGYSSVVCGFPMCANGFLSCLYSN
jgi:hypothetical protein